MSLDAQFKRYSAKGKTSGCWEKVEDFLAAIVKDTIGIKILKIVPITDNKLLPKSIDAKWDYHYALYIKDTVYDLHMGKISFSNYMSQYKNPEELELLITPIN